VAVHAPACANCGAEVRQSYCPACGQSGHIHRSLLHLGEEILHGVLHLDAKGWRTLPMLVLYPGQLTRRYVDGQRTRYVSPLVLFLFMMFLMFFVVSATTTNIGALSTKEMRVKGRITHEHTLAEADRALARAQAALAQAQTAGAGVASAAAALAEASGAQQAAKATLTRFDAETAQKFPPAGSAQAAKQTNLNAALANSTLLQRYPGLGRRIQLAGANFELTLYKLKNTAYKFAFLLLPISLPFIWLLFFRRRDVTMYDHAVFALYSMSFMSLLLVVMALCDYVGLSGPALALFLLAPPLHMFVQLRGAYALALWPTLWRTATLLALAAIVFLLYLALILVLTVL
jgi:F0F1-type ATP synthase membrane subunit b/b'